MNPMSLYLNLALSRTVMDIIFLYISCITLSFFTLIIFQGHLVAENFHRVKISKGHFLRGYFQQGNILGGTY